MDHRQLTKKQLEFFHFIREYRKTNGIWPTYREIADALDYKSPNSVTQNIKALIKKGVLRKSGELEYELADNTYDLIDTEEDGIPVRGVIAAGYLQEAVEANLGYITLQTLFPGLSKMFALRVSGMSMKNAGIYDGDFVLLADDDLKDGDIGAVLYNGETSLKRIFFDKNGLRLEPANEQFSDIVIEPDIFEEVRVLGKYVGHVNRSGITKN
jgi:SOS regulatory protein LexA